MKVLFIGSAKANGELSTIITSQGESLLNAGITVKYFPIRKKGLKGYVSEAMRLRKFTKNQGFHLLHAHYGFSGIVALIAKRKEKVIVSFMGDDLIGSNTPSGRVTIKSKFFAFINALLSNYLYNHTIVKSVEMLGKLRGERVTLLPNGVDLKMFFEKSQQESKRNLNIDDNQRIVLFVSDPTRVEKNYQLAVEAIKLLHNHDVMLLPVFDKKPAELVDYYNAADLLILTSFHEGSPNVIKEALACNCPIVSTDVGDVKWLLKGVSGCYISSFNLADFTAKTEEALSFSGKPRTNGISRIQELELDVESVAAKLIDIYKSVLE